MFEKLKRAQVVKEPFPHLVIENALPENICEQLIKSIPESQIIRQAKEAGSNMRFSLPKVLVDKSEVISDVWREALSEFSSPEFFSILADLFLSQGCGSKLESFFKTNQDKVGIRGIDSFETKEVLLDALICENTPVIKRPSSVRGPHVDDKRKIFAGLLYLRPDEDDSIGGDLEIYKVTTDSPKFRGHSINKNQVEIVKTVPYKRNTLIIFLNSPQAVHGVTKRHKTKNRRIFMNLVGEVENPIFKLEQEHIPWSETLIKGIKNKLRTVIRPS